MVTDYSTPHVDVNMNKMHGNMNADIDMNVDVDAFEQYRRLLFAIAYRMVGTAMEAEDIVQETYLRYRSALPARIDNLKGYLTTITTRLSSLPRPDAKATSVSGCRSQPLEMRHWSMCHLPK